MGMATFPGDEEPAASGAVPDEAARLGFGPGPGPPGSFDAQVPRTPPASRRALAVGAVALVVLAGAFLGYRALVDRSPELPGQLAGTPRMGGPQIEIGIQAFRSQLQAGGMEGDMAFYGEGGLPSFAVAWFHDPSGAPLDSAFRSFSMGFASASQAGADPGSVDARTIGRVRYLCASGSSLATAICMWRDGDAYWVVLDVRPGAGAADSRQLAATIDAET